MKGALRKHSSFMIFFVVHRGTGHRKVPFLAAFFCRQFLYCASAVEIASWCQGVQLPALSRLTKTEPSQILFLLSR
jgi:hypothetical protein